MAYEKTNWQNGVTPVNAQNMNHIEDGISANDTAITQANNRITQTNNNVAALSAKMPTMMLLDEEAV